MDRRSWPWKKKSSDKAVADKATAVIVDSASGPAYSTGSQGDQSKQENHKKAKYVQISVESYSHLTGLEDQVKSFEEQMNTLEDEIKELNEKCSAAQSEITNKENMVKQHAKVAEEAVSGWEKAEAEASTLKNHLESVTLLKLTAEDRASQLDGALKECMRQIRSLKEEHEQKLHDLILNKTKQFDKMKLEFEAKIANLDKELLRSAAQNSALSRSLQERSNMLIKISEEKAQAEAEIEMLKSNIESCENELTSLKYELNIAAKELEIRSEEKNMTVRSAEVANKQHLEGAKKIAKLEAECQRLRGLVRKKLPGPAALAQMKLEVEGLGRDYGESRLKKFTAKPSSLQFSSLPDFSFDTIQRYHKENELLTERLFAMEEETKMLKEALAKRNSELQASRSIYAETVSKLQNLEAQVHANGQYKSPPRSTVRIHTEGAFSQNASIPPSSISMSEDGNDDNVSCAGSWATTSVSELSHIKKEKNFDSPHKSDSVSHMGLMDDFLEMEKLANLSNDMNGAVSSPHPSSATSEIANIDKSIHVTTGNDSQLKRYNETDPSEHQASSSEEVPAPSYQPSSEPSPLMKLQSRISMVLGSLSEEADMQKLQEDLRQILQEVHDSIRPQSALSIIEAAVSSETTSESQLSLDDLQENIEKDIHVSQDSKSCNGTVQVISKELADAMSQIHDFVMFLGKEAEAVHGASPDGTGVNEKLDEFSATYLKVVSRRMNLVKFVLDLSKVLCKASELHFSFLGYKTSETEMSASDCIDKVALPENKGLQQSGGEYSNVCARFSDSSSNPDIPLEGRLVPTSESTTTSWKCSLEEFEQLKLEKDSKVLDLARYTENLESTKSQLAETEKLLAEMKSQLISAQKSNSLAETQLKCMAESYRSLETRTQELQTEVNLLQAKIECLDNDLQEEKKSHYEALARCKDLEEQIKRLECCPAADTDATTNQEKDLAAAVEKLAECQETIFLLGKQLKALHPQTESTVCPWIEISPRRESVSEEPTTSSLTLHDSDLAELDTATSVKANSESPKDLYNALYSPSDSEVNNPLRSPIGSKHPKHRPTKSSSSSSSGGATPEKQSRGFSRFFSTKVKVSN